ncbi:hypothetical protein HDU90_006714 [Geranomyces variabilis]|nr:hypothetical protein HDU90_006714 [Geranomyces variabilis]
MRIKSVNSARPRLRRRTSAMVIVAVLLAILNISKLYGRLIHIHEEPHRKHYTVIASEENPMYSFFVPLTAMVWERYIGFTPIVFLIDEDSTKDGAPGVAPADAVASGRLFPVIEEFLRVQRLGIVRHLKPNASLPANGQVLSQTSRLMASLLPELEANAYLLTSDVDLWPLAPTPYWTSEAQQSQRNVSGQDIALYNALCCGHDILAGVHYREYPMSCIGMSVKTWHQVIGIKPLSSWASTAQVQDAVVQRTNSLLSRHLGYGTPNPLQLPEKGGLTRWYYDQILVSYLLALPGDHTGRLLEIPRDTVSDRMDRIAWPTYIFKESLSKYVDAHLLRPGYSDDNWPSLRRLLALLLCAEDMVAVDNYYEDFKEAMKSVT